MTLGPGSIHFRRKKDFGFCCINNNHTLTLILFIVQMCKKIYLPWTMNKFQVEYYDIFYISVFKCMDLWICHPNINVNVYQHHCIRGNGIKRNDNGLYNHLDNVNVHEFKLLFNVLINSVWIKHKRYDTEISFRYQIEFIDYIYIRKWVSNENFILSWWSYSPNKLHDIYVFWKIFKSDIKSLFFRTTHSYHFMQVKLNKPIKSI